MTASRPHPVFSQFRLFVPGYEGSAWRNSIGVLEPNAYWQSMVMETAAFGAAGAPVGSLDEPPRDEDYFEWIDLLTSVRDYAETGARRPYVFAELGAGYGRWSVNAICALRQKIPNADYFVVAAEAEPEHFAWLGQHLAANNVAAQRCRLFAEPVSGENRMVHFYTGNAASWYGQSMADEEYVAYLRRNPRAQLLENAFLREPGLLDRLLRPRNRRRIRAMRSLTVTDLLQGVEIVDMMDMDIQGAEVDVIESGAGVLRAKVRKLHVGTHSAEIERRLREILPKHGWSLEHDYACQGLRDTPFGRIKFDDGVQTWTNESLRATCA